MNNGKNRPNNILLNEKDIISTKIFNLIILIVVDIIFKILFNNLVESFCLPIGLKIKSYRKFIVYFQFYYKYYKEL